MRTCTLTLFCDPAQGLAQRAVTLPQQRAVTQACSSCAASAKVLALLQKQAKYSRGGSDEVLDRFQDGAATANNPAAIAVQEALLLWPDHPIDCLVRCLPASLDPTPLVRGLRLPIALSGIAQLSVPQHALGCSHDCAAQQELCMVPVCSRRLLGNAHDSLPGHGQRAGVCEASQMSS